MEYLYTGIALYLAVGMWFVYLYLGMLQNETYPELNRSPMWLKLSTGVVALIAWPIGIILANFVWRD